MRPQAHCGKVITLSHKKDSLVMEFAENGDMYEEIMSHQKSCTLPDEDWVWRTIIQIVRGLKALHALKILHRDLKSANVFLSDEK